MSLKISKTSFLDTNVELACSNDDLRLNMQCVYFKDGFLYATDGHIAIKQHIKLHGLDEDHAIALDDKFIHKSVFKDLKKNDHYTIESDGIVAHKGRKQVKFLFEEIDSRFPDVDAVLDQGASHIMSKFAINPDDLARLNKAFIKKVSDRGLLLSFTGDLRPILVHSDVSPDEQVGVVMPRNYQTWVE